MPKVENMTRPPRGTLENSARLGLDPLPWAEQNCRIEVPLDPALLTDLLPAAVEVDPPVEADYVAARRRKRAKERRRPCAEMDRRHVERIEDLGRVRRDKLLVVGRRERSDPRIEHLNDVGARTHLALDVPRELLGELCRERMPELRLAVHHRLHLQELATRPPLDQICGDRERAAAEADHCAFG